MTFVGFAGSRAAAGFEVVVLFILIPHIAIRARGDQLDICPLILPKRRNTPSPRLNRA